MRKVLIIFQNYSARGCATKMRTVILLVCICIAYGSNEADVDFDFKLLEDTVRNKRAPDSYGAGLGGPLAAGIMPPKPDKDGDTVTAKPYDPETNYNNSKKCDVVRPRKYDQNSKSARQKASDAFDAYVEKYKKTYPSQEAKEKARETFIKSQQGSYDLNRGRCSKMDASFATTRYSDWKTEDFVQKLGGSRQDSEPSNLPPAFSVTEEQSRFLYRIPRWDWRSLGVIPAVRDQKECGGCYAFSTTDLLSAQEKIDKQVYYEKVEPYSAQYFIDCMPEPQSYGCKGGRPAAVLDYMANCTDCVILIDRCYQYRNRALRCKQPSLNCKNDVGAKPVYSKQVNLISNREAETMATLLRWGPVVAVVELGPAWQFYNGTGVMRESHCGKKPNHAVLIVGYDYTGDVPYYIIKNSWSSEWGDGGYVKLEAGRNTCGVATAALVTCTDKTKCADFSSIEDFVKNPHVKPEIKPDGTRRR